MGCLCLHHQPVQGARKVQSQNNGQGDEHGGQRHKQGSDHGGEPAFSDIVTDDAAIVHNLPRFFKGPHRFDPAGQKGYGGQENTGCDDQETGTSPGADGKQRAGTVCQNAGNCISGHVSQL